jgi:DNA adenine methylase
MSRSDSANSQREEVKKASPLLKWAGGKRWFLPVAAEGIRKYLQKTGRVYFEPFVGGGAMAFSLGSAYMTISDAIEELVEFYQTVRDEPALVAWQLSAYAIEGVDKENYLRIRDLEPETAVCRAARMLYLNRLGFNGLYRVNKSGKFNVPYGDQVYRASVVKRKSRDAIGSLFPHKGKIEAVSEALRKAFIVCNDFEPVIKEAGAGDLIYADPPYDGVFGAYTAQNFSKDDQERLAVALYEASERGAAIIAHNANTKDVWYWYHEWMTVIPVGERRIINSDAKNRGAASCVVVTNVPELLQLK